MRVSGIPEGLGHVLYVTSCLTHRPYFLNLLPFDSSMMFPQLGFSDSKSLPTIDLQGLGRYLGRSLYFV